MKSELTDLAVNGGSRAVIRSLPTRHLFSSTEKAAVAALFEEAIDSGIPFGYNGPQEEAYAREFSEFMGGGFTDPVNSGTNAVYIALRALNPEPFTEIIVPPVTDPGGMMPVPLLNCIPIVADAEPGRYNTGPRQVEQVVSPLTSAIVIAHIGGEPVDMKGIMEVAEKYNIPVVEDCAQSHGATIDGCKVGTFGRVAAFSTMFGKHHCTGGQGGLVFTRDQALYQQVRRVADRGKPFGLAAGSSNCVAALNCNLDELGAVIGRAQLTKLPEIIRRRQQFAGRLRPILDGLGSIRIPSVLPGGEHVYWWWRLELALENITCDKSEYCAALAAEGVLLNPDYRAAMPQSMEWFVKRRVFGSSRLPWNSPAYQGDPERDFPCPNANAAMDRQFNLTILETWGEREAVAIGYAFAKVDAAYGR